MIEEDVTERERAYYYLITDNDLQGLKSAFEDDGDGCTIMPYGQSLVLHAVLENKLEILKFLVEQGCDLNKADDSGMTPLHVAAETNNINAAEALLAANVQVEIEDKFSNTPLFKAVYAYEGDLAMISMLVTYGANPLHKNISEISPYSFAKQTRMEEVVDFFKTQGFIAD